MLRTALDRTVIVAAMSLAAIACSEKSAKNITPPPEVEQTPGSIGGSVSVGSTPLAGVAVSLSGGRTTSTDASGVYLFGDVAPGAYILTVTLPAGYKLANGELANRATTVTAGAQSSVNWSIVEDEPIDLAEGARLFDHETFGGNGRTCLTCHMAATGTITLHDIAVRLAADRDDPLFRHDALDNGTSGTSRLAAHGTIRVELELPTNVTLANNPSQRTIVVNRGVPSTLNAPGLDSRGMAALMYDLREPDLLSQARNAVVGHAQSTVEPTQTQLEAIAALQRQDARFFSSDALRAFASGGPAPQLPTAVTESEVRGRLFFVDAPLSEGKRGSCAVCHSGPGLNEVNQFGPAAVGLRQGARFGSVLVAERNANNNPVFTFNVEGRTVTISDPGIMLTSRSIPHISAFITGFNFHPAQFAGFFKTPTLWGVKHTAPYFHDNSAKTLRQVVDHYADFFFPTIDITLTEQDKQDIVAFLERF